MPARSAHGRGDVRPTRGPTWAPQRHWAASVRVGQAGRRFQERQLSVCSSTHPEPHRGGATPRRAPAKTIASRFYDGTECSRRTEEHLWCLAVALMALPIIADDSRPCEAWLAELLDVRSRYEADVVSGPVEPEYESKPAQWMVRGRFHARPRQATGTGLSATASSG